VSGREERERILLHLSQGEREKPFSLYAIVSAAKGEKEREGGKKRNLPSLLGGGGKRVYKRREERGQPYLSHTKKEEREGGGGILKQFFLSLKIGKTKNINRIDEGGGGPAFFSNR